MYCVTQPAHAPHARNRSPAPVALQQRHRRFSLVLDHVQFLLRCQYITRNGLLGTLMSHYLPVLAISVLLLTACMVDAPATAALVAHGCAPLAGQARLEATTCTAVALTTVALRTHPYFALAPSADVRTGTEQGHRCSRHRVLPLEPHCMPAKLPAQDLDLSSLPKRAIICLHSWVTRVGRASCNYFPRLSSS